MGPQRETLKEHLDRPTEPARSRSLAVSVRAGPVGAEAGLQRMQERVGRGAGAGSRFEEGTRRRRGGSSWRGRRGCGRTLRNHLEVEGRQERGEDGGWVWVCSRSKCSQGPRWELVRQPEGGSGLRGAKSKF